MNYNAHFPEFVLRRTGNKAVWEFSLIVFNDTYEDTMAHKESACPQLFADKVMGFRLRIATMITQERIRRNGIDSTDLFMYQLLHTMITG